MSLYRIIDTNQRERGPFSAERICQRIADGRSDAQTKVQVEGSDEWIQLGDIPEFAEPLRWGDHPPPNPAASEAPTTVVVEAAQEPTKRCAYCGRENAESAASCSGCGTSEFVGKEPPPDPFNEPAASPPVVGAHAVHAASEFVITGGFRLRESDASCQHGLRTVTTSVGGAKVGVLAISRKAITFEQRLSFAGGFLLVLLGLLPAVLLGFAVGYLLSSLFKLSPESVPGILALLMMLLLPLLPLWIARRTRRFQRRFSIHEMAGVRVRGPDVVFSFRGVVKDHEAAQGSPAVPPQPEAQGAPRVTGDSAARVQQLAFRPANRADVARLTATLSAAGISVSDPEGKEKAEFAQRLAAIAPKSRAWATPALIGLNVLIFICLLDPAPSKVVLLNWGANWGPLTTSGQWGRLLSSCFLHWNIGHLVGNMWALLMWGLLAERLFGKGFYLEIYFGCGLAASLASLCWHPLVISAGASGAVFGVCGALLGYLARQPGQMPGSLLGPLLRGAIGFVAANLGLGWTNAGIDQAAHVGGLLSGLVFGWVAARPLELESRKALTSRNLLQLAVCVVVVLAGLFAWVPKAHPAYASMLNSLGVTYARGEGVGKDEVAAAKWYRKAAELGNPEGEFNLGSVYYNGQGVEKDPTEALKWWRQAGEHGMTNAQVLLGTVYYRGEGVAKDYAKALKWIRKAAERGVAHEQCVLGLMYGHGEGTERDMGQAINWIRKAAEQGLPEAQSTLVSIYYRGEGTDKDYAEAAKWARAAANRGNAGAQLFFGTMCAAGQGMEKDKVEAYAWLSLAAGSGTETAPPAAKLCEALAKEMSPDALAKAKRRTGQLARTIAR